MRARDVRHELQVSGAMGSVHPGVIKVLETIAEEQHSMQKTIAECVSLISMTVESMEKFELVATNMKQKLEGLQRGEADPESSALST
jgi:hypothetical protein